jgi:hypothetical protein
MLLKGRNWFLPSITRRLNLTPVHLRIINLGLFSSLILYNSSDIRNISRDSGWSAKYLICINHVDMLVWVEVRPTTNA